jgi:cytochrome b
MTNEEIKVWDLCVRVCHWTIVAAFGLAYVTEDDLLGVHVWAGYVVGIVVVLRVGWGIIGPRWARFSDFVRRPSAVLAYLLDLVRLRARRYLGHSPAGGAMVVALLLALTATVVSGLATYGADKHAGPVAPFFSSAVPVALPGQGERARDGDSALKEVHEFFANLTLVLVLFHIAGVALGSLAHRENLVRAMVTGRKHMDESSPGSD